jgi:hypothetical protein
VWRDALWMNVYDHGITGKMFRVLRSLYCNVESAVLLSSFSITPFFDIGSGVRQGCILSPILFSLFINTIIKELKKSEYGLTLMHGYDLQQKLCQLLFADDIVLLASNTQELQNLLNLLYQNSVTFRFFINYTKSMVLIFGDNRTTEVISQSYQFTIGNAVLDIVKQYKYLGLHITHNLSWSYHLEKLRNKCKSLISMGMITAKNARMMNMSVGMNIWESLARPTIEYGSEILFTEAFKQAETCQHYFGKRLLELKQSTCNSYIRGELGLWRMKTRRNMLALRYYKRLHQMDDSRLPKQMLLLQKRYVLMNNNNNDNNNNNNVNAVRYKLWYECIKDVMDELVIDEKDVDREEWNTICYRKLEKKEREDWLEELNKEKLQVYRKFKQDVEIEKFLLVSENRKGMLLMVKLRSGSHFLRIETGRYEIKNKKRLERHERLCLCCDMGKVEDEYHFLFECVLYHDERKRLYDDIMMHANVDVMNMHVDNKFKFVLSAGLFMIDHKIVQCVQDYLCICYDKRMQKIRTV